MNTTGKNGKKYKKLKMQNRTLFSLGNTVSFSGLGSSGLDL